MILDRVEQIASYISLGAHFEKAAVFIANTDLAALENGRHAIDDDRVYALVLRELGKPQANTRLEAHRRYADIQLVLEGTEKMGWISRPLCDRPDGAYDDAKDVEFFHGEPELWVTVRPGRFALFLPDDVHAPMVSDDELHKVVVKVQVA
jgi:biofilm protein TabA